MSKTGEMRGVALATAATLTVLTATACPPAPPADLPPPSPATSSSASAPPAKSAAPRRVLHESLGSYDFEGREALVRKIVGSPFKYLRFTSRGFAKRVCASFEDVLPSLPTVNLHGDAHLEQFAVTSTGYGLVDFDDATAGPAVIDLVRFGVSLRLGAKARGWDASSALDSFFAGYRTALHHPSAAHDPPSFVTRARSEFSDDRMVFLARAETLMMPLNDNEIAPFRSHFERYVDLMVNERPSLDRSIFTLKSFGNLRGGVGSALDHRLLIRVEGPSSAPEDDVILEAKELRDMRDISCVRAELIGGRFRTIVGRARLGNGDDPYLALIPRGEDEAADEAPIWVQSWLPDYRELDTETDLENERDLEEVSFHVGVQLGRGHVVNIATPFDDQLRRAELDMLRDRETRIRDAIDELTEETLHSWQVFRGEAAAIAEAAPPPVTAPPP